MLDGIWQVYKSDGTFIGMFQTRIGNDVLQVNKKAAKKISVGDTLHMDETHSSKAWEVRVTGNYSGDPTEFTFEKLSDRAERYPPKESTVWKLSEGIREAFNLIISDMLSARLPDGRIMNRRKALEMLKKETKAIEAETKLILSDV